MNHSIIFFAVFVAVVLLGLGKLILSLRSLSDEEELFEQYCMHFNNLISEPERKATANDREWLIRHSYPMSDLLGPYGIAYQQIRGKLSIPVNLVPELCHDLGGFSLTPYMDEESCKVVMTCLGQFEGVLDQRRKALTTKIKNPLAWLAEGVRMILSLPVIALESVGLIGRESYKKAIGSRVMQVVSGIASLITIGCFVYEVLVFLHVISFS